ncbi:MAG TPA: nucleotidyltransferase domain-containing protein [Chloroflexi bacterium]|nr:MAG: hypothetical protein B6243_08340 [Anaerolineaceae bacterium 4572_5.2]HEY84773.1 nucleotidyltransferase domain-containing protein [Chloroflexota bacterium]
MSAAQKQGVSADTLNKIVEKLVALASPSKIILFGSNARGEATPRSDLDILVIERELTTQHAEALRLGRALRHFMLPIDLVVVSETQFNRYRQVPGTVYYNSQKEGRVLYAQ